MSSLKFKNCGFISKTAFIFELFFTAEKFANDEIVI